MHDTAVGCRMNRRDWPDGPVVAIARPHFVLLFRDRWTSALLRAELIEMGEDAVCASALGELLVTPNPTVTSTPCVVVAEQEAVSPHDGIVLEWLRAVGAVTVAVLITRARAERPSRAWDPVLQRPIVVGDLCGLLGELSGTGRRKPPRSQPLRHGFRLRLGRPWPMAECQVCRASRHCERPRTLDARAAVRRALVLFGLAHDRDAGAHTSIRVA